MRNTARLVLVFVVRELLCGDKRFDFSLDDPDFSLDDDLPLRTLLKHSSTARSAPNWP